MKTLKFMLAAATAIGLASASQAVGPFAGSTDFESYEVGTNITEYSLWSYAGATAADNESVVADAGTVATDVLDADRPANFVGATPRAKILQVSTGTDPILRDLQSGLAPDLASTATIYVDTLVQFTVTPATDPVTPNAADKLMIYLKEMTNSVGEVSGTNLCVVASNYQGYDPVLVEETKETVQVDTGVSVEPNTWQRLVVESSAVEVDGVYVPVFKIKVGATQLTSGSDFLFSGTSDNTLFPSLQGSASTTLSAVGFAGEGKVDDLAITTFDPTKTLIDFTLVQSGFETAPTYSTASGYSGDVASAGTSIKTYDDDVVTVSYTKDSDHTYAWTGATVTESESGSAVTATFTPVNGATVTIAATAVQTGIDFTLTLATGVSSVSFTVDAVNYEVTTTTNITLAAGQVNYTATFDAANWYTGETNGSFTVAAAPDNAYTVTATRENASGVITSETTPADLGITAGAFAAAGTTQAELTKVVDWAVANNKTTSDVNAMTFATPLAPTDNEKSYLLGTSTADAVTEADAVAALEIASIEYDETDGWVIKAQNNKGDGDALANGHIAIFGAATVNGEYTAGQSGKNFFKAVLVK